jgi:histidinol-phosphate phosphatase family protein
MGNLSPGSGVGNSADFPQAEVVTSLRPAVFLDRDGTLMEEVEYCREPEKVRLLPGVEEGLARLRAAGYALVIVSNQSGIGRGWIKLEEYEAVHARLLELLGPGLIEAAYFCPDAPEAATGRRKPAPGMLLEATRDLGLELARSWMIGDKASDAECAHAAGVGAILVQTGYGASQKAGEGTLVARDFSAAVERVLLARPPARP